jgi:hypothetical protein
LWYTSIGTEDEVAIEKGQILLAYHDRRLLSVLQSVRRCQNFDNILMVPAAMLHPIIKPWPFRGWGLDFIGQIHPSSSKSHHFVLVAIDYFTKWTKAVRLKNMKHKEVIKFITKHIIHRFNIPQTLTTD